MIIKPYLDMTYGESILRSDFVQNLLDFVFERRSLPFIAIFGAPYDMIVDIIHTGSTMCVLRIVPFHMFMIS